MSFFVGVKANLRSASFPSQLCSPESEDDMSESTKSFSGAGGTVISGCCLNQFVQRDLMASTDVRAVRLSVEDEVVELSKEAVDEGNGTCT